MAKIEVIEDLMYDVSGSLTENGYEDFTRAFIVTGLDVTREKNRVRRALAATGIPFRGAPHPSTPYIVADTYRVQIEPGDPTVARVIVRYVPVRLFVPNKPAAPSSTDAQQATISVGSVLQTVETSLDVNRFPLLIEYLRELAPGEVRPTQIQKKIATAQLQVAMPTVSYSRDETKSEQAIRDLARDYVGRVNGTQVFGDPVRTWMCMGIHGNTESPAVNPILLPLGNPTFRVDYNFQRSEPGETWDTTRVYHFTENGEIPTDVVIPGWDLDADTVFAGPTPNGAINGVRLYQTADFHQLNLSF